MTNPTTMTDEMRTWALAQARGYHAMGYGTDRALNVLSGDVWRRYYDLSLVDGLYPVVRDEMYRLEAQARKLRSKIDACLAPPARRRKT